MSAWAGCLGVRLHGEVSPLVGRSSGEPLLEATVTRAPLDLARSTTGEVLWEMSGDGLYQALRSGDDGVLRLVAGVTTRPVLDVDPVRRTVLLDADLGEPMATQFLVTYALPLLLAPTGVLVLHGSAARPATAGAGAVVVVGQSGRGKSSVLVALTDAGWTPVSEDLCAIDERGAAPAVWPGPPWVRRSPGEPGPAGAALAFETADKAAWSIGDRQPDGPVPLAAVVGLEAPGPLAATRLDRGAAIALVAGHAVWLGPPGERAAAQFPAATRLPRSVAAWSLRFPHDPAWTAGVPAAFAPLTTPE